MLEKGSSGAREVCEKELGRVASLGGRGVRERSLGSEEVCERKGFVPSLPFLSFSQVYCWCEREETARVPRTAIARSWVVCERGARGAREKELGRGCERGAWQL